MCTTFSTQAHLIWCQCLEPIGSTVAETADGLAVSRNAPVALLNCRLGISSEMPIRLSQAFGGRAESWLRLQVYFDLWPAQPHREHVAVRKFALADRRTGA